jgi:hypothetical protein
MKQGLVVGLDTATTTGAAWHHPGMPRPFFKAFKLPGLARDIGQRCDALDKWLSDLHAAYKAEGGITHIFLEEQHLGQVGGGKGRPRKSIPPATIKMLAGLSAIVQTFAYQIGANCYETGIADWRKHFLGRGTGFKPRGECPKELSIQRCAQYGWHTDSPDAAEACGILDYSLTLIPGYVRPWRDMTLLGGPLS